MKRYVKIPILFLLLVSYFSSSAQNAFFDSNQASFQQASVAVSIAPFQLDTDLSKGQQFSSILGDQTVLQLKDSELTKILKNDSDFLKIELPLSNTEMLSIALIKSPVFSENFTPKRGSDKSDFANLSIGSHYWGTIAGDAESRVALSFTNSGISGSLHLNGRHYTLGKVENSEDYILYADNNLLVAPDFECGSDDLVQVKNETTNDHAVLDANNCVNMYIEVDNDIYQSFGTVGATTDYITGVFNQVGILYANESVNFGISELVIWNTTDPYTGTSTSGYLNQFQAALNGVFNGDLAHLVGFAGGGGIAYVDVLCVPYYGIGYSGITASYNDVPTYSWTVEVLTHEIGHNLGSQHTHACAWNGNNTAIDGCGPAAGYSEGCSGPVPSSGTIMSYCHLVSGVGIDFNLGFGPQPGDLIRSNVYNASCLTSCTTCETQGNACDDGDPCTIGDVVNSACVCEGTYTDADGDGYCVGEDADDNDFCNPNASPALCSGDCVEASNDTFESGWGTWNDGGGDCSRFANTTYASSGSYSIMIRDNSGAASATYSDILAVNGYETIQVDFNYHANSMESGEDFLLQISTNGGSTYTTVESWASGSDFSNNTAYSESVTITNVVLTNSTVLRFMCDASTNSDQVFLDDIVVIACANDGGDPGCQTVGEPCQDGDNCTEGEAYDSNCNCVGGVFIDADGDGFCAYEDPDDNNPCSPDNSDPACQVGCSTVDTEGFESGWGIWNDGGGDCARVNSTYSYNGNYSIQIRDNSGAQSSTYTDAMDMSAYSSLSVTFYFIAVSMENNEDFMLEISTNGGSSYTTIESWAANVNFVNNQYYIVNVDISGYSLTANTVLRFRCDASGNADNIYLDDVTIEGCVDGTPLLSEFESVEPALIEVSSEPSVVVYPNPIARGGLITVQLESNAKQLDCMLYDVLGNLISKQSVPANQEIYTLPTDNLSSGAYILVLRGQSYIKTEMLSIH